MERVTISLSRDLAGELTAFMETHRYGNRSEAIRDLARLGLERAHTDAGGEAGDCVATLSYVFSHHTRELSKRLTNLQHGHHDLHVAAMMCTSIMRTAWKSASCAVGPGPSAISPRKSSPSGA